MHEQYVICRSCGLSNSGWYAGTDKDGTFKWSFDYHMAQRIDKKEMERVSEILLNLPGSFHVFEW